MTRNKDIYIYYDKNTKIYKGNDFKEQSNKYENCDFIKIKFEEWKVFLDTYPDIIRIEEGKLKGEKRAIDIEEVRDEVLRPRKTYLKQTFEEWFDDVENIPQEVKDKRKKIKKEIKEIETITEKEDLKKYEEL